jgi:hypothetical protein
MSFTQADQIVESLVILSWQHCKKSSLHTACVLTATSYTWQINWNSPPSKGKETIEFSNAKGTYSRNLSAGQSLEKQCDRPAVCVAERCTHFKTGKSVTWNGRWDHSEFRMPQSASIKGATKSTG